MAAGRQINPFQLQGPKIGLGIGCRVENSALKSPEMSENFGTKWTFGMQNPANNTKL